jgi:hypothetical protein
LWVLETSTNPDLISAAAAMATELQRPQGGFGVALDRLEDTFWASFTGTWDVQVRDGFVQVAIVGGRMQRSNLAQAKVTCPIEIIS